MKGCRPVEYSSLQQRRERKLAILWDLIRGIYIPLLPPRSPPPREIIASFCRHFPTRLRSNQRGERRKKSKRFTYIRELTYIISYSQPGPSFINLFVQYSQSDLLPLRPLCGEAPHTGRRTSMFCEISLYLHSGSPDLNEFFLSESPMLHEYNIQKLSTIIVNLHGKVNFKVSQF